MKNQICTVLMVVICGFSAVAPGAPGGSTDDRLHAYCVSTSQHAKEPYFTMLGPTGINGWVYLNRIYVDSVEPGSPADGMLRKGDYLLGVAGRDFPLVDPRIMVGNALTQVEATDGKLQFRVGNMGKERKVTLQLKPLGKYAPTWPADCKKSAGIRDRALLWLRDHQRADGTFGMSVYNSLDGLFLLASPAPADREAARRSMYGRLDGQAADCYASWSYGYSAMALAEYYLATGDALVLPRLEFYSKEMTDGLATSGTWGHGMAVNGVLGGYGELNCAGVVCFLALVLMDECGVAVDPAGFAKTKRFFGRFAGLGSVPYGNNDPWTKSPSSNGKDAVAALAFDIAGDLDKARAFADTVAMGYAYTEDAHTGAFWGVAWNPLAARLAKPEMFRKSLDEQLWYYELQRRWDGGFEYLPNPENLTGITGWKGDPITVTGGYGLMYALPWKSLRLTGATPGPFSKYVDPSLKPAVELFKAKKWADFDAAMKAWPVASATADAKRQAAALLAKRADLQAQVAWTLAEVDRQSRQAEMSAVAVERAKAMLGAAERLVGEKLEKATGLRQQLAACKISVAVSGPQDKRQPEQKWVSMLPLAKDATGQANAAKVWRVHAWTGDIDPLLDNLEPAGPALKGWYLPDFNDSAWQQKPAPFRAHSSHPDAPFDGQPTSPVSHYDCMYQPRPLYNAYARLNFTLDDASTIKAARIVQQNCHQYLRSEVYLNGYRVAAILRPNTCELSPDAVKLFRKGNNTLAIYLASCRGHLHDFDFGIEVVRE